MGAALYFGLIGLAILIALVEGRHWAHDGKGRWVGVKKPDNVVRLDDYRKDNGRRSKAN